ncbi:MAG: hypothetical protein ACO38P_08615 [Phycisphaerales bacterium]
MSASPTPRLVAFHIAARADDAAVRSALSAAEVVHESDPLVALATLGCRELAAKNRGTWGLGPTERFAVVLGDDRPDLERLRVACERHLPHVELWRSADGGFSRIDFAVKHRAVVRRNEPEAPSPRADDESSPRIVSAEEIRMLLGDDLDPPPQSPERPA